MAVATAALGRFTALCESQFTLESQIGTGSFGTVFKALHKPTQTYCAIKRIDLESSDEEIEEIRKEIAILAQCNNPFITRYFGCFVHEFELWICMEYLGAGSCLDLLKSIRPGVLPEAVIADIVSQMVQGLVYLHNSGKIHRDIKAANVLISESGDVRIADFGVAAQLSNYLSRRNTFVGTPFWMAPEVINEQDYSFEADIWSLGITAIELAHGKPPQSHLHPMKALFTIPRSDPPKLDAKFSEDFQDFVHQCLQMHPPSRAKITELADHPFLARKNRVELVKLLHQPKTTISVPGSEFITPADGSQTIDTIRSLSPVRSPSRSPVRNSTNIGKTQPTRSSSTHSLNLASQSQTLSPPTSADPNTTVLGSPESCRPASRTSTVSSQCTLNDDNDQGSDDDWDFDTIKPEPSLEQILQNPPRLAVTTPAYPPLPSKPVLPNSLDYSSGSTVSSHDTGHDTLSGSISGTSLARIFNHAARKFKEPMLHDISDLLRADPPTLAVEGYLVKRISKLAAPSDQRSTRDPIEQILLDKWLTEVREAHQL